MFLGAFLKKYARILSFSGHFLKSEAGNDVSWGTSRKVELETMFLGAFLEK